MEKLSTRPTGIKYGVILGLLCALLVVAIYIARLDQNFGLIGIVLTIAMCFLAVKEFKEENQGYMTLGQGVGMCLLIGLIGSAISSGFDFIYTSFIDPGIIDAMLDDQMAKLAENPAMTDEAIDQAREMSKRFSTPPVRLGLGLVSGILGGAFWGLIVSAILKKDPPEA